MAVDRNPAALILAITQMPFGLAALAQYLATEAEVGPLTNGFEDLLLDNLPLSQKQAKAIADVYRQLPHVVRAIKAEDDMHAWLANGPRPLPPPKAPVRKNSRSAL